MPHNTVISCKSPPSWEVQTSNSLISLLANQSTQAIFFLYFSSFLPFLFLKKICYIAQDDFKFTIPLGLQAYTMPGLSHSLTSIYS